MIITKRKFDRVVDKIKKSIDIDDSSLPINLCSELRSSDLWSFWCTCVIEHCRPGKQATSNDRKKALPKFIKDVNIIG